MSGGKDYYRFNLQAAMDRAALSQRTLAQLANVHYTHVNQILKGRVEPGLGVCEKLASAIGVSVHDLTSSPAEFQQLLTRREKSAITLPTQAPTASRKKVDELEVIAKLNLGLTHTDVGKLLELPESVVARIGDAALKRGLLKNPRKSHDERREARKQIADWVADGHTAKEAAAHFKSSEPHVRKCCNEFGIEPEPLNVRFDRRKVSQMSIIALLIDGLNQSEVAEHFGVTRQYVNLTAVKARKTGVFDAVERAIDRALKNRGR